VIPPSRTAVWSPIENLADLDVAVTTPAGAGPRVEIVDKRLWTELVSLTPAEAAALGAVLQQSARQAGWAPDATVRPQDAKVSS
jgi:hypothetical protein